MSQEIHMSVRPPLTGPPRVPVRLVDDCPRWAMILAAIAGADRWCIKGSRGVVQDIFYLKPDYVLARGLLPASHPHHTGPTFPGPILTDVER